MLTATASYRLCRCAMGRPTVVPMWLSYESPCSVLEWRGSQATPPLARHYSCDGFSDFDTPASNASVDVETMVTGMLTYDMRDSTHFLMGS